MGVIPTKVYSLTSYKSGSIGELLILFLPLLLSLFSGSLMSFCDRLFISHYSLISLKSVTTANYFCMVFQLACSRITATSQVYIGKSYGEGKTEWIGPYCWQMIWFSLLSMCITFPIGMGLTPYLFNGTEMATQGSSYFRVLMYGNFLFPLGAGFSAYFIGLGRTKIIGIATLGSQLINIGLNYVLIFGVVGIIPSLGAKGAAFATLFSQAIFCLSLFVLFFWERRAKEYGIRNWTYNKKLFKETLSLGMPKSLSKISVLIAWSAAVRLVSHLEGDYLLVLTIGSSIWLIFSPITQTLEQVLTTQVSFYRGNKQYPLIWTSVRSAIFLVVMVFLILGVLFFFYFNPFLSFFIHEKISPQTIKFIKLSCYWLWIFFLLEGLSNISLGLLTGLGETLFTLKMNVIINWPTIYLPYYLAFCYWNLMPDKVWMLSWVCMIIAGSICFIKGGLTIKRYLGREMIKQLS